MSTHGPDWDGGYYDKINKCYCWGDAPYEETTKSYTAPEVNHYDEVILNLKSCSDTLFDQFLNDVENIKKYRIKKIQNDLNQLEKDQQNYTLKIQELEKNKQNLINKLNKK